MACGLQPAAAAALWPHLLSTPRRSDATKEHPYRVPCMDQFQRKLPLGAAESYRSMSLVRCTSSGSSAKAATLIRRANVSTAHNDLSMRHCMDAVPGAHIVVSGYWTGPDTDDGCGYVEAILQRIV